MEPDSAVVRRVEAAGAGDFRAASNDALLDCFRKRQDADQGVRKSWEPIYRDAPATWADTTEGRVCRAAQVAAFNDGEPRGDGKNFVPGR